MRKSKKNRSFATRLSQWVMLVLFVMMCAMAFLLFTLADSLLGEMGGETVHGNIVFSERHIQDFMSDVKVAVDNNLFEIEGSLNQPDQMQIIVERMVKQNPRIRSCGISFVDNYYPQKGHQFCPYAWRTDSMEIKTTQLGEFSEDYLKSDWFVKAIAKDSAYWSDPFIDGHDAKTPLVAFLQPIHDKQGKVVAILGADLSLDFMTEFLQKQDSIFESVMWMGGSTDKDKMKVAKEGIEYVKNFFFNQLELKNSLSAIGIDDKNFEMMAEKACGANGFINGWKKLYPKDVFNIYQASL